MRLPHSAIVAITLTALLACTAEKAPNDAPVKAVQQATATGTLERPMAHRLEGQAMLDSAQAALTSGNAGVTKALLHRAATFFVAQANTPASGGSADLLAAAGGLDALANDVGGGRVIDPSQLSRLSAHANLGEAERHGALAAVAWSLSSKESVSDELTMAADHIERAAVDARIEVSPAMRGLLGQLRAIISAISTQRQLDVRGLEEPLSNLHVEIRAMHRRLERSSL